MGTRISWGDEKQFKRALEVKRAKDGPFATLKGGQVTDAVKSMIERDRQGPERPEWPRSQG